VNLPKVARDVLLASFDCFKALENRHRAAIGVLDCGCSKVIDRETVDGARDPSGERHRHRPFPGVELAEVGRLDAGAFG